MTRPNRNLVFSLFLLAVLLPLPQPAWSYSAGITGYSGSTGDICVACHTGGVAPNVTLSGPTSVEAGSVNSYTLSMNGGQAAAGGFNISSSAGSLSISMSGTTSEAGELKHSQPFIDSGSGIEWTFSFEAPVTIGPVTIYAAALSANGDFQMTGDNATAVTLDIQVTEAQRLLPPSANLTSSTLFAQPGESIQFNAGGSTDGDGSINRYLWDFGDGSPFEQGVTPSHSYATEGNYVVTMAATDNDGLTDAAALSISVSANAGSAQGEALYNQHCFACHGTGGTGGSATAITGVSSTQIDSAITNIGAMQSISLTAEEIQLIADFLASGGGEPPPRPTDGPGLFSMFCSACHGADGRGGSAIGVTGAPLPMILEGINNVPAMQGIDLTVDESQLVANFLTNGGGGAIPTSSQGLYSVFCSVCHGTGGHGGKFFAVTGASNPMITEAVANVEWMQPLNHLNNDQKQLIAEYLGAGGEPPLPMDAQGLYGVFCQVCHGSGGHGGKFKAVTGASSEFIGDAIVEEPWMNTLQISLTQRQQIAAYLGAGGEPPLPSDGAGLYGIFCAVCHGAGGHGGAFKAVTGAPEPMIADAINQEPYMDQLLLSGTQRQAIANFLTDGGGGALPTDGAGLYGVFCSVCHGADGRGGAYKVVTGTNQSYINRALNNVGLMTPLQINSTQVASVTNFLAAGGAGSKPTTGSGLYHVYCETCHGPDGRGGPEESVRGQSAGSISSALSGESAMRHLRPYLSTSDVSLISNFLSN